MLEKPFFPDECLITCLQAEYGLHFVEVAFLPLSFGLDTAVYRAVADDETQYLCKLKRGGFSLSSVELPRFLSERGMSQVIPPRATKTGQLVSTFGEFGLAVYPFIEGKHGYEVELTDRQWADFGAAIRSIHTTVLSPALKSNIPKETYAPVWRDECRQLLGRLDVAEFHDPIAVDSAAFLRSKWDLVLKLINGAEQLAPVIAARDLELVLCRWDMHPGNLLVDIQGDIYIIDWDSAILAPKECDLMYIGGGYAFVGRTDDEEERLFYRGYGPSQVDSLALAYFRLQRSIIAIVSACEQIHSGQHADQTQARIFEILKYYFLPNGPVQVALKSPLAACD